MNKLHKGLAGSGKSTKLIDEVYSLIDSKKVSPSEVLILTLTPQEREVLNTINNKKPDSLPLNIQYIESFCMSIINKSPDYLDFKGINDDQGILLINAISKKEFSQSPKMYSLTKSSRFSRELYNLFGLLKSNDISDEEFFNLTGNSEVNKTDKTRLYMVANVYAKYNRSLNANQLIDYRDYTKIAIEILKSNYNLIKYLTSAYKYICIDGFQNISLLQLELIRLISYDNLILSGDEFSRIQQFKGAWQDNLDLKALNKHFEKISSLENNDIFRNRDILKRAIFLINCFNNTSSEEDLEKSHNISYAEFEDIEAEVSFIANEIHNILKTGDSSYSDFAVILRDYELKHKFIDLFKSYQIPVDSELANTTFSNLKTVITRYLGICNVLEKMNLEYFNPHELEKIDLESKVDLQNLHDEINLYFENILSTLFSNIYYKQKLLSAFENSTSTSLIASANRTQGILPEEEKLAFQNEIKKINRIYGLYRERKLLEFISDVINTGCQPEKDSNCMEFIGILMTKINSVKEFYTNVLDQKLDFKTIIDTINSTSDEIKIKTDSVKLESAFRSIGKEYKYVFIPGITEKTFPKKYKATQFISPETNLIFSDEIREAFPNFKSIIESDEDSFEEEIRLFYLAMTRAKEKLYLSTHLYEDKKQVQPSIFFTLLKDFDYHNFINISEPEDTETIKMKEEEIDSKIDITEPLNQTVLDVNEEISLSASSIGNYLSCPKQYFYRKLIALKEETTVEASYGLIAHCILETFNNRFAENYTKDNLLTMVDIYFNSINDPEAALEAGYKHKDIQLINNCGELTVNVMKENLVEAIQLMEDNLYFKRIFESIETEKSLEFQLEEIQNVKFKSRIDAIYQSNDGYTVVDYKTGSNKKKMNYYVSEYGVRFEGDYGQYKGKFSENNVRNYEYQIPLYYIALQLDQKYKDKLKQLGLMYIRPRAKDNGYKEDLISADLIEEYRDKIIKNISDTVVDPIRETVRFEPHKTDDFTCQYCSYKLLCDGKEDDDE